jgi:hypothetical protein
MWRSGGVNCGLNDWERCLRLFQSGTLKQTQVVYFGKPSQTLKDFGLSSKRIGVVAGKLHKFQRDHSEITIPILKVLSDRLNAPEFILSSATEPNSVVVVPIVLTDGRIFVVPIRKDVLLNSGETINMTTSIYFKDDPAWLTKERNNARVLYERG